MNEKGVDLSKSEVIKEESKEEVQKESKEEESTRKRKLGTRKKMKSRKRRYIQNTSEDDSDKENDEKYPIKEWKTECLGTKPQADKAEHFEEINQNVVIRSNGQKRYFSTLMRVLSIFDREDLNAVYQLQEWKYCELEATWFFRGTNFSDRDRMKSFHMLRGHKLNLSHLFFALCPRYIIKTLDSFCPMRWFGIAKVAIAHVKWGLDGIGDGFVVVCSERVTGMLVFVLGGKTGEDIQRTIDQSASGKLRDRNAKESWALLEDLALYHNKSWKDPRDFAKLVKEITLPQDVSSTSDRRLIDLEN
ncbi:hypothetical protein Tco_1154834 [Tanacetum coccineum]